MTMVTSPFEPSAYLRRQNRLSAKAAAQFDESVPGLDTIVVRDDEHDRLLAALATLPDTTGHVTGGDVFEVMFDGVDCTATGPSQVVAGIHPFVVTDVSGMEGADVRTWVIEEGYSYDDALRRVRHATRLGGGLPDRICRIR